MPGKIAGDMTDAEKIIEALQAYRGRLLKQGQPLKAAAVAHCIKIVRRLAV